MVGEVTGLAQVRSNQLQGYYFGKPEVAPAWRAANLAAPLGIERRRAEAAPPDGHERRRAAR